MDLKGGKGFLVMTISFVGIVLFTSIFLNIMEQLENIRGYANIDSFLVLSILVQIAPATMLIGALLVARWGYSKGELTAAASDSGGLMRMVFGAIGLILFIALFYVFLPYMYYIYDGGTTTNGTFTPSNYIALQTVASIVPSVLFIGGIFYTGRTAYRGYKARRARKKAMLA